MQIHVNGEPRRLPPSTTVADLLERLGLAGEPVAVECNREIVPRAEHSTRQLHEGDRLEIVTFVGGG